jgi:DNA-binding beta-propeller fold protein YncE
VGSVDIGSVFAGYEIEDLVGRGGMGVVYRARQLRPARTVALKVVAPELSSDADFRRRFETESQVAAALEHPNVVPVYEVDEEDGVLFLAMRFVDGVDLRALIRRGVDPERAARIVDQVAGALDAAHARGLVHRDVKPANILVSSGTDHVYLTDFGLTKEIASEDGPTRTGTWVGSIDYVPPEQIQGERVDARADVYALTAVLFHALTGQVPYPRDTEVAKLWAHMQDAPPSACDCRPDLPPGFDAVIARGMAKDPDDRYASAGDLGRAALAVAAGRRPETTEHSVATGAAAPDTEVSGGGSRAVTDRARTQADAPPSRTLLDPPPGGTAAGAVQPRRRRGGLLALGVIAGVLAIAAVLAVALGGGDEPDRPVSRTVAPRLVGSPIPVPGQPGAIAAGAGSVWVTSLAEDAVTRIDARTGQVQGEPTEVGRDPAGVAVGQGGVWVANFEDDTVSRLDPATGRVVGRPLRVGDGPADVAVGLGSVWTADYRANTITRLDARTGRRQATIRVGVGPFDVAVGADAAWSANSEDDTVSRINPTSNRVVSSAVPVGESPESLAIGEGRVWVGNIRADTVTRLDAATSQLAGPPIRVGERPDDVAVGAGGVWVANQDADTVLRIEPRTGRPGPAVRVGNAPAALAVDGDVVWVANFESETVVRVRP